MLDFRGKRVLVLGLGVNQGGIGMTRYLVQKDAEVRVTDLKPREQLSDALEQLADLPIQFTLGEHDPDDIRWADIIVRNPAVPRESPWLALARDHGVPIEMEMTLFFRQCPAPIIGVTGTKGKTTTASMLATLLRETWPNAPLAGNMGRSAMLLLDSLGSDVPVVIELSSFQLEGLHEAELSPHISVITNISEDHLDRYPSFDAYAAAKASISAHQSPEDWLVINRDDPNVQAIVPAPVSRRVTAGLHPVADANAIWIQSGRFQGRWNGTPFDLGSIDQLALPGEHVRLNALLAMLAALAAGADASSIQAGIRKITAIPDRQEHVATLNDVDYINDTTATVPEAAIAALLTFAGRQIVVIAGGSEKHVSMTPFADALSAYANAVVLLDGTATPGLIELLGERNFPNLSGPWTNMEQAVEEAARIAEPGGVVLLSPGCASFGIFRNEFERGERFRQAVHRRGLTGQSPSLKTGEERSCA